MEIEKKSTFEEGHVLFSISHFTDILRPCQQGQDNDQKHPQDQENKSRTCRHPDPLATGLMIICTGKPPGKSGNSATWTRNIMPLFILEKPHLIWPGTETDGIYPTIISLLNWSKRFWRALLVNRSRYLRPLCKAYWWEKSLWVCKERCSQETRTRWCCFKEVELISFDIPEQE